MNVDLLAGILIGAALVAAWRGLRAWQAERTAPRIREFDTQIVAWPGCRAAWEQGEKTS